MITSKKGLGPTVEISLLVLLTLITISLVVSSYNSYFSNFEATTINSPKTQYNIEIIEIKNMTNYSLLSLKFKDYYNISISEVIINETSCTINSGPELKFGSNTVNVSNCEAQKSNRTNVQIITSNNIYLSKNLIAGYDFLP